MKDDWNEVVNEAENQDEFEGTIWKPEMVDEAIIGTYVDREDDVGQDNTSKLYHIKNKDEDQYWKVWGSAMLNDLFKDLKFGVQVKLVYKGQKQSKNGRYYKVFKLFTKPGAGGEGASASSSSTVEKPRTNPEQNLEAEVINIARQAETKGKSGDWFNMIREQLPDNKEDLKEDTKKYAEWINRIRQDLIGNGTKEVTIKMVRDNVAALHGVEHKESDLGLLDEKTAQGIFKLLRMVEV